METITQLELEKLRGFSDTFENESNTYEKGNRYIDDEVEKVFCEFLDRLIWKYDWEIIADDTHRWVDSDGFYEVEFSLFTSFTSENVYIHTECGGSDLQDSWSKNNPQKVYSISDCYMEKWFDFDFFLGRLVKAIDDAIENGNLEVVNE